MEILIPILIFIFGAAIGSFLNVLAERLPKGESSLRGRSHCDHCGRILGWRDLIPIISFLALRGRCRYCKKRLSFQYPVVEAATGVIFLFIFLYFYNPSLSLPLVRGGLGWGGFSYYWLLAIGYWLFIASCFIVIFIADLKYFIIPDEMIIAGVIGTFLYRIIHIFNFFGINSPYPPLIIRGGREAISLLSGGEAPPLNIRGGWEGLYPYLLASVGAGLFFLAIVFITKGRGMGLGDVKLAFLMGLILGWPNILLALFTAFFLGAIVGVALILARKAGMKSAISFGPFLIAGTFISLFFGTWILDWYSGFLPLF